MFSETTREGIDISLLLKGRYISIFFQRGKQLYWYIYLTPNNQKFQYGDYDPDTQKYMSKKSEVAVSQIAHVVTGKQSPHVKDHR